MSEAWLREVLSEVREPCDCDDGGMRGCCGTRQLGPHAENCLKPPSFQDGMLDHERMYVHECEVSELLPARVAAPELCRQAPPRV